MNNFLTLDNVSLAYGLDLLLDNAKLQVAAGERVCLIGRNGAGKSSLLKIIEGSILPDAGLVWRRPHLRIARLQQELPLSSSQSVYEFVAAGLAEAGALLAAYHLAANKVSSGNVEAMKELEKIQQKIEAMHAWHFENEIKNILSRLDLKPDLIVSEMSGGWQRRVALARALVTEPELLLLDEPTNHLDIEAIQWLEDYLLESKIGLIFITHDRALLQRLATRIIELDRGQLTSWPGDYQNFLDRKAAMLQDEAKHHAEFDKKLAQEEKWIRQGIKARRTRNEGRVRALEAMRLKRSERREVEKKASFNVQDADKSGQLVIEAKNISQQYADKKIINHFSVRIMRGDRIGLIGPNGAGKTTLLNLLLGKISPQEGTISIGTKLEVAYFDQLRGQLDPEKTVVENLDLGGDFVELNGQKRHVIGYLSDFLFTSERALTKVKALSGGECNRLLLAQLFKRPANFLILDEPTNDLDIETLELLEEILSAYQGTLLLVSHDRKFLNNVVTSTLVFGENGQIEEYIGGYQESFLPKKLPVKQVEPKEAKIKPTLERKPKQKLTFKEQEELKKLPMMIERLEKEIAEQEAKIALPEFYKQSQQIISDEMNKLHHLNTTLASAYQRWEELEI